MDKNIKVLATIIAVGMLVYFLVDVNTMNSGDRFDTTYTYTHTSVQLVPAYINGSLTEEEFDSIYTIQDEFASIITSEFFDGQEFPADNTYLTLSNYTSSNDHILTLSMELENEVFGTEYVDGVEVYFAEFIVHTDENASVDLIIIGTGGIAYYQTITLNTTSEFEIFYIVFNNFTSIAYIASIDGISGNQVVNEIALNNNKIFNSSVIPAISVNCFGNAGIFNIVDATGDGEDPLHQIVIQTETITNEQIILLDAINNFRITADSTNFTENNIDYSIYVNNTLVNTPANVFYNGTEQMTILINSTQNNNTQNGDFYMNFRISEIITGNSQEIGEALIPIIIFGVLFFAVIASIIKKDED